jgi:phosphate transport system substrate-binding protein
LLKSLTCEAKNEILSAKAKVRALQCSDMVLKSPPTMKLKLLLILSVTMLCLAGCGETIDSNEPQGFIQVKGSDTLVNAAQMVAEEFMKDYPHIFVAVTGGGSGVGIASLINKTCNVATASREMKPKEIETANQRGVFPKEFTVAYDGVAVIVNNANPVEKLTINDLHRIFTGKATNWKDFGGKDAPIVTLSREVSSGTYAYFKEEVVQLMKKGSTEEFSPGTLLLTSSQAIVEEVAGNEDAIGYLGMGYLSERTKAVAVARDSNYCPPSVANVLKKAYPLSRGLYFYTNGEPEGVTKLFVDFALSPKGQRQFVQTGFVPAGNAGDNDSQKN